MDKNIIDSQVDESVKIYRNVYIKNSVICSDCSVGDETSIVSSDINSKVAVNRRNYINNSHIGSYTYTGINNNIGFACVGKFCSIGRNVNIGGSDHNYKHVSTMPLARFSQFNKAIMYAAENIPIKTCSIGNDVWIGDGACILSKATVSDGAVIGAGAVVTGYIPPYAIAAGVPARVIGYRFEKKFIEAMLKIKWWHWPEKYIVEHAQLIFKTEMSQSLIDKLNTCSENVEGNLQ